VSHQRGLAGAVLAHQGDHLAAPQLEVDALEHWLVGLVPGHEPADPEQGFT
jgi:hypothetical protein